MNPTFRDIEQLSAFLDGQLSRARRTRLEARLASDPQLSAVLSDLRLARGILRRAPRRRPPRSFTLTPTMAGVRPPAPSLLPVLNWASAVAALLFFLTLGTNLFTGLAVGAPAAEMFSAPMAVNDGYGGGSDLQATGEPLLMESPSTGTSAPEEEILPAPQASPGDADRALPPAAPTLKQAPSFSPWPYIWSGLALLLIFFSLVIRWVTNQAFKRRSNRK